MTPFSYWEENGTLEFQEGSVRIYRVDGENYLFVDQTMYASTTEQSWYVKNVMPKAYGKCLEIGLGLGVASKSIIVSPEVRHLLTIEQNEYIIKAFGRPLPKHNILQADVYEWAEKLHIKESIYDFIFVDHYADMEDETFDQVSVLVKKLSSLLTPIGNLVVWVDENAPEEDIKRFKDLWISN